MYAVQIDVNGLAPRDISARCRIRDWLNLQDPSKRLNLSFMGLTSLPEIPSTVIHFDCSDNKLTELPSLDKYVNLKILYCAHNELTSLPSLDKCVKLEGFNCSNNKLTSLPSLDNCVNLRRIYCERNLITSLPSIDKCRRLDILDCYKNPLEIPMLMNEQDKPHDYFKRREIVENEMSRDRIVSRARFIYQELISVVWHPSQVEKWIALYGIDFEDFV